MTRRRFGVHAAAAAGGGGAERVRLPAATAACTRMDRRAPCATPPAVRSRESQRMPEWQKPAGGRMVPPYRYGEGVHAAGRHGARRSSYVWASCSVRSPNRLFGCQGTAPRGGRVGDNPPHGEKTRHTAEAHEGAWRRHQAASPQGPRERGPLRRLPGRLAPAVARVHGGAARAGRRQDGR